MNQNKETIKEKVEKLKSELEHIMKLFGYREGTEKSIIYRMSFFEFLLNVNNYWLANNFYDYKTAEKEGIIEKVHFKEEEEFAVVWSSIQKLSPRVKKFINDNLPNFEFIVNNGQLFVTTRFNREG